MCVCVWGEETKCLVSFSHICSVVFVRLNRRSWREEKTPSARLVSHLCSQMCSRHHALVSQDWLKGYDFKRREQIFPHLLFLFMYLLSCRWTWRLCRSSFRRWPSGTRASPAPARGRTDSREGSAPSASWTTGWQRLAWTDKGKQHESFM